MAIACAVAAVLCIPTAGLAGPIKLNLAGVAVRTATRAVIKAGRTTRAGDPARVDDPSSMSGGESGDSFSAPDWSGNARYSMNDMTSLFGMWNDDSNIFGGNTYGHSGDGFSTLAALLLERAGANLKSGNGHSNQGNEVRRGDSGSNRGDSSNRGNSGSNQGNSGYSTGNDRPGSGTPTRVPEPDTVVLFGAGLLGVAMLMKRESGPREL